MRVDSISCGSSPSPCPGQTTSPSRLKSGEVVLKIIPQSFEMQRWKNFHCFACSAIPYHLNETLGGCAPLSDVPDASDGILPHLEPRMSVC